MTVIGERPLRSDELSLKILPSTFTFDVTIKMRDAKATYDLEKGRVCDRQVRPDRRRRLHPELLRRARHHHPIRKGS